MMLFGMPPGMRIWLYNGHVDMRSGFDRLSGLVSNNLGLDPLRGGVFVFVNRRRTHCKLLCWDHTGYVLYYKRLERGTFELPKGGNGQGKGVLLSRETLLMLLEGIALDSRRRKRYRR